MKNAMQLKAVVKNIAKEKKISSQLVLASVFWHIIWRRYWLKNWKRLFHVGIRILDQEISDIMIF